MSKRTLAATPLFEVHNSDWNLVETSPGTFELSSTDGSKKLSAISGKALATANAVIAELERHLREKQP